MVSIDFMVIALYLGSVVCLGVWVGQGTQSTDDFFFAGRRYRWPFVAISCVATLVGSYSFIQYSETAYRYGWSALVPYTNDWFVLPLFLLVYLPIIYKYKIASVPEYFSKRFDESTRDMVSFILFIYLIGYIGINLLTIGVAADSVLHLEAKFPVIATLPFQGIIRWQIVVPAAALAFLSSLYLRRGGQRSVIVTDIFQGFILLATGLSLFILGVWKFPSFAEFWSSLPTGHQAPFTDFNSNPHFNGVGDFWNDAVVGTFAFYFINQGILMRFLSARSVKEGRKALIVVVAVFMPITAIAVSNAGIVARALETAGMLEPIGDIKQVFMVAARAVAFPGFMGLVVAAVLAALMSTLDTLITAVSAVGVNDIVKKFKPNQPDQYYLKTAQRLALLISAIGVLLVPLFDRFQSIYQALSFFTSVVIPPLAIVCVFAMLLPKYSARSAKVTLILGSLLMVLSVLFPVLITPFAHGIPATENYTYIRSFFGVSTSAAVGLFAYWLWDKQQAMQTNTYTAADPSITRLH